MKRSSKGKTQGNVYKLILEINEGRESIHLIFRNDLRTVLFGYSGNSIQTFCVRAKMKIIRSEKSKFRRNEEK